MQTEKASTEFEASIQHGPWGGPYRAEKVEVRLTADIPWKGRTQSGYGKALPTNYMIRYKSRWLRVKCVCYSNSGTLWARVAGVDTVVYIDRVDVRVGVQKRVD